MVEGAVVAGPQEAAGSVRQSEVVWEVLAVAADGPVAAASPEAEADLAGEEVAGRGEEVGSRQCANRQIFKHIRL